MSRLLLSKTLNTRDIGGYVAKGGKTIRNNMFFRSDVPAYLSDEDVKLSLNKGITTIIDLRSDEEVAKSPCAYKGDNKFKYYHCKIHGDGRIPQSVDLVPVSYFEMVDEEKTVVNVIKVLANAEGAVLYHCTAGKDRTGVITALLMLLAGASRKDILADYAKTLEYLRTLLQSFIESNRDVDINIVTPKEAYMDKFLDMFHQKYKSVEEYFIKIGIDNNELMKLKEKLLSQ